MIRADATTDRMMQLDGRIEYQIEQTDKAIREGKYEKAQAHIGLTRNLQRERDELLRAMRAA